MSKYVARRRVRYPVGKDRELLERVGGLGQLPPEERRAVAGRLKTVDPRVLGDEAYVDDAPPGALAAWLRDGVVEEVTEAVDIGAMSAGDAVAYVGEAPVGELDDLRDAEKERARGPRVSVMRAIADRREESD